MKEKAFFISFKGLSLKQIKSKTIFLENESQTLRPNNQIIATQIIMQIVVKIFILHLRNLIDQKISGVNCF